MKFFKMADMAKSWSNWVFAFIAVFAQVSEYIPVVAEQGSALYVTLSAVLGIIVRSIKQK